MGASLHPAPLDSGAYFDDRAALYDRFYDGPSGYALRSRMAAVLDLLGAGPAEVLDAGMGPGRLLVELAQRDWVVHGIDASAEMVAAARRRLPRDAARLIHGRIESLPFPDASFDAAVATGVLEYANVGHALGELRRVLRPGGTAVVSYPNPGNLYWFWRTHVWYRAVGAAKRLAPPARARVSGAVEEDQAWPLLRATQRARAATVRTEYHKLPRSPIAVRRTYPGQLNSWAC